MRFCVAAVQVRAGPGTLTSHGARTPGSDPVPGSIPGHLKAPSDDDGDDAEWGKEAGAGLGAGAVGSTKLMVRLRNVPFEVPPPPPSLRRRAQRDVTGPPNRRRRRPGACSCEAASAERCGTRVSVVSSPRRERASVRAARRGWPSAGVRTAAAARILGKEL